MPDGSVAELIRPPTRAETLPPEPPAKSTNIETAQESNISLKSSDIENIADAEEAARAEFQDVMSANAIQSTVEPAPKNDGSHLAPKKGIAEFLSKHRILRFLATPILALLALFGIYKKS